MIINRILKWMLVGLTLVTVVNPIRLPIYVDVVDRLGYWRCSMDKRDVVIGIVTMVLFLCVVVGLWWLWQVW